MPRQVALPAWLCVHILRHAGKPACRVPPVTSTLGLTVTDPDHTTQQHIDRFGCSVIHVAAEDELPPFSYSVGIEASSGAPEVVVIGLKQQLAHFIVNEYNRRIRTGDQIQPGNRYEGFLEGFDVAAATVDPSHYDEYFGQNLRYYSGRDFRVLQLIYPNKNGVWPWQREADQWFKSWQPILSVASSAGEA